MNNELKGTKVDRYRETKVWNLSKKEVMVSWTKVSGSSGAGDMWTYQRHLHVKLIRFSCAQDLEDHEHGSGHVEFQGALRHPDEGFRIGS